MILEELVVKKTVYHFKKDLDYAACFLIWALLDSIRFKLTAIIWYTLCMVLFILITYRRYYPFFAKLVICDEYVEKTAFGHSFAKLSRDHLQISIRLIKNKQFIVFSSVPTAHLLLKDLRKAVRNGNAIMYPVTEKMREDYPSFFAGRVLKT